MFSSEQFYLAGMYGLAVIKGMLIEFSERSSFHQYINIYCCLLHLIKYCLVITRCLYHVAVDRSFLGFDRLLVKRDMNFGNIALAFAMLTFSQ